MGDRPSIIGRVPSIVMRTEITQLASDTQPTLSQHLPFNQRKQQTDNEQLRYI